MTDQTNPNATEVFGVSPHDLDRLFDRTAAGLVSEREARQRAAAWPGQVEEVLTTMARTVASHGERIAALEARLAAGRG